jgi:hypothetical protein
MKFAGFLKFALLSALAGVFGLALSGCGANNNLALTQGNWAVTATSTTAANVPSTAFNIGGNLTQSGSHVSGTMHVTGSECFDPSAQITITGTVSDKKVTLTTAASNEQVITVTATGTSAAGASASALSGNYTVTGGCAGGDQGTVTANAVPSISGTWAGTLANNASGPAGSVSATISIALTQAATASSDGTFALTGNITYTNSACSVSGTLGEGSSVNGQFVLINAGTVNQDAENGSFTYGLAPLDSASAPANVTGAYQVGSDQSLCPNDLQTLTLTKQ